MKGICTYQLGYVTGNKEYEAQQGQCRGILPPTARKQGCHGIPMLDRVGVQQQYIGYV